MQASLSYPLILFNEMCTGSKLIALRFVLLYSSAMSIGQQRRNLGQQGESEAEQFLRAKGYAIVAKNFRSRIGEIDLVAVHRQTIVFVEVRSLSGDEFGDPLATVTPRKQRQIAKTALLYLSRHKLHDRAARFDVIGIQWSAEKDAPPRLTHIQDAFDLPSPF
jgi:putative endonuclease